MCAARRPVFVDVPTVLRDCYRVPVSRYASYAALRDGGISAPESGMLREHRQSPIMVEIGRIEAFAVGEDILKRGYAEHQILNERSRGGE